MAPSIFGLLAGEEFHLESVFF
ncbi:hypothetical protein AGR1A_Lc80433 [Agrobacterium fabacearum CFBP 5771]|nr:hypothetical protein AGR1A_Lc80433 [Agrobacterium fabacearum CFBP 5771]